MSHVRGALFVGDILAQCTYLMGRVEPAVRGSALKALSIYVGQVRRSSPDNYWVLTVGRIKEPDRFEALKEVTLSDGLPKGVSLFTFNPPLVYDGGDYPAVRLRRHGGPGPLRGVVLIAEFDVEGDDERATR